MALFFRFKGVGGCRWLLSDEMLGSFMLSLGTPGQRSGQESWLSGPHGLGVVWQVQESLCSR